MNTPLVSIIIPTYNRAHLIGETLDSVLAQTYPNWECIIVDDGSTDNTAEVIKEYVQKDARFQYHTRPNSHQSGGNGARNYGFLVSKGEYVNWLDSDDLICSNKIDFQIKRIEKDGILTKTLLTCNWDRFTSINDIEKNRNYKFFRDFDVPWELLKEFGELGAFMPPHCYLVERSLLEVSGLWNEYLKVNQDGEFFSRVIISASKILYVKESYAYYRSVSGGNTSRIDSLIKARHVVKSWKLIDIHMQLAGIFDTTYVNFAKNYIYGLLKSNYNLVIKEEKDFFKEQLKKDRGINKIIRKLF